MTLYPGTLTEQEYAHGRDEGYSAGERDLDDGLGLQYDRLEEARTAADVELSRAARAFTLGWMRGYREATRTYGLRNGRWSL